MITPDESGQISVHVDFNKQETYQYWVSEKADNHWHGASWSNIGEKDNPSTFNSGETFSFTFSTTDGWRAKKSKWRLNSFQVNGYDVNVPTSYNVGSKAETTLPSGTKIIIECIKSAVGLFSDYNFTYKLL